MFLLFLCIVALLAAGWYYAELLRADALTPDHGEEAQHLVILAATESSVTLGWGDHPGERATAERPGTWGLASTAGYGRAGTIMASDATSVTREFQPMSELAERFAGRRSRIDLWGGEHLLPLQRIGVSPRHRWRPGPRAGGRTRAR